MCVVVEMIPLRFPVKSQGFQTRLLNIGVKGKGMRVTRKRVQEEEVDGKGGAGEGEQGGEGGGWVLMSCARLA